MDTLVKIFKSHPEAIVPKYATEFASCFDIHACIQEDSPVTVYSDVLGPQQQTPSIFKQIVNLPPQSRALIKTGLIFDLPVGYSLRLHPRSGLALKFGITLMNAEGVVDEDYIDPVGVILFNSSRLTFELKHGDRICQAEIVRDFRSPLVEITTKPEQKTNRSGGFGSTGK